MFFEHLFHFLETFKWLFPLHEFLSQFRFFFLDFNRFLLKQFKLSFCEINDALVQQVFRCWGWFSMHLLIFLLFNQIFEHTCRSRLLMVHLIGSMSFWVVFKSFRPNLLNFGILWVFIWGFELEALSYKSNERCTEGESNIGLKLNCGEVEIFAVLFLQWFNSEFTVSIFVHSDLIFYCAGKSVFIT